MKSIGSLLLTACVAGVLISSLRAEQPNVLFIAVDDLVPTLGCYGDQVALTPEIDGLASQGMTFLNHHCQWAVCGPSRVALSTGLMPEETGVMGFKPMRAILPDVITLPQHFRSQGYETACTGKFHDPRTVGVIVDPNGPTEGGSQTDDVPSWSTSYVKASAGYAPAGKPAVDDSDTEPSENYADHHIKEEGLALIDQLAAGGKPFFLAVGFKKPHLGFYAPRVFWNRYDRSKMPLARFSGHPADASIYTAATLDFHNELKGYSPYDTSWPPSDAQQRELLHGYYACVSMVDDLVGELLDELAGTPDPVQLGKTMAETTIVVLWGDHGFHLGDHGRWGKHTAMEEATRCPLIIYDPRSPTTATSNESRVPVNSIDIYPTLCELAGLPVPEQPLSDAVLTGRPLRGRSLVPVLEDPEISVHDGAISHFNNGGQYGYAYRTDRFRYIEWVSSGVAVKGVDLYDYLRDPLETRNLAEDPKYAAIVHQLSRSMRAETTTNGAVRLGLAPPSSIGGDAFLTDTTIMPDGPGGLLLDWPACGGVSYDVRGSSDLTAGWIDDLSDVPSSPATLPIAAARRFFVVGFGENVPPVWVADPLKKADAALDEAYGGGLAGDAVDSSDALTFSLIDGPAWLSLASDGSFSGTPGAEDRGAGWFTVEVTDAAGATARASLQISVVDTVPPPVIESLEEFPFNDAANTSLKELANIGSGGASFEFNAAGEIEADGSGRLMIGDDPGVNEVTGPISKDWYRDAPMASALSSGVHELEFRIEEWRLTTAQGNGIEFTLLDSDGTALKTIFNSVADASGSQIRRVDNGAGGSSGQTAGFERVGTTGLTIRTTIDLDTRQWKVDHQFDGDEGFQPTLESAAISSDFTDLSELRLVVEGSTVWTAGDFAAVDYLKLTALP